MINGEKKEFDKIYSWNKIDYHHFIKKEVNHKWINK
jgi:hypothetical protein